MHCTLHGFHSLKIKVYYVDPMGVHGYNKGNGAEASLLASEGLDRLGVEFLM